MVEVEVRREHVPGEGVHLGREALRDVVSWPSHLRTTLAFFPSTRALSLARRARDLVKYISTSLAFVIAFFMFGTPSAPGVTVVEEVASVETGVGGCAYAYNPGGNDPSLPVDCQSTVEEFDGYATTLGLGAFAFSVMPAGQVASATMGGVGVALWAYARYVSITCQ